MFLWFGFIQMSYRYMRILVMFDLPVITDTDRREYRKFRKFLILNGFLMLQADNFMKLVHAPYQLKIDFHENKVQVLVLERAETFAELVGELFAQISGEEGQFLLADQTEVD